VKKVFSFLALIGLPFALSLIGCATVQMVSTRADSRAGILRYWIDDNPHHNENGRAEGYKKIYDSCGGPYRVVSEDNTLSEEDAAPLRHGLVSRETSQDTGYWYIHFECLSAGMSTSDNNVSATQLNR
jgi:hypothetical protein